MKKETLNSFQKEIEQRLAAHNKPKHQEDIEEVLSTFMQSIIKVIQPTHTKAAPRYEIKEVFANRTQKTITLKCSLFVLHSEIPILYISFSPNDKLETEIITFVAADISAKTNSSLFKREYNTDSITKFMQFLLDLCDNQITDNIVARIRDLIYT